MIAKGLLSAACACRRAGEELATSAAARVVGARVKRGLEIGAVVEFVFAFELRGFEVGIDPIQVPAELQGFLETVMAELGRPRALLEIGTARGGTLLGLATVAADDAIILSVDLPFGSFGGGYPRSRERMYKRFARAGQQIRLYRMDSHDAGAVDRVRGGLQGRPLDLLFVDGDHEREGVLADLRMYSGLVREGGLVGLHDIVPGEPKKVGGSPGVWAELKAGHDCIEIVSDWGQGGYGIGLIRKATPLGAPLDLPDPAA